MRNLSPPPPGEPRRRARCARIAGAFAAFLAVLPLAARAQSTFDGSSGDSSGGGLPYQVPSDLIEPSVSTRSDLAHRFARFFSAELRDLEARQEVIVAELEKLPRFTQGSVKPVELGYHSGQARTRPKWVQVDLGDTVEPDAIALVPVTVQFEDQPEPGYGFPTAFRVDISNDPDFRSYETMVDYRDPRNPAVLSPRQAPFYAEVSGFSGRYVRITATRLWRPETREEPQVLALGELIVLDGVRNAAAGKTVTALDSSERSSIWSRRYLTDGRTILGIPHTPVQSPTYGFYSESSVNVRKHWVEVDLGDMFRIEEVRLTPANPENYAIDLNIGFPQAFQVDIASTPDFSEKIQVADFTPGRLTNPGNNPLIVPVDQVFGRYVRVTVPVNRNRGQNAFALAEMVVISGNTNVALGKKVRADSSREQGNWSMEALVDGYSSRYKLADFRSWLQDLDRRTALIVEWRELEERRTGLVESTVTHGLVLGGVSLGVVGFLLVGALARGRSERLKEVEKIRNQIASDLHDDIGSNLSSIALLAELGETESDDSELSRAEFKEIVSVANRTIESMRDIVWMIRPGHETWAEFVARLRATASHLLTAHQYSFRVEGRLPDGVVALDFKRDLFLMFKEILNNIVKHAHATSVQVLLQVRRDRLQLIVEDNGVGFDTSSPGFRPGNGLRNLQQRSKNLKGDLRMKSATGEGTTVHLSANVP